MSMTRLELQDALESVLDSTNVYFNPPASFRINYPAIIYKLENIDQRYADDKTYKKDRAYMVTLIHQDPDNDVVDKLVWEFPKIRFDRTYVYENLYHYVYVLYE